MNLFNASQKKWFIKYYRGVGEAYPSDCTIFGFLTLTHFILRHYYVTDDDIRRVTNKVIDQSIQ